MHYTPSFNDGVASGTRLPRLTVVGPHPASAKSQFVGLLAPQFTRVIVLVSGCGGAHQHEEHETQLLDNKVLQQRVQAALHRGGKEFQHVQVNVVDGRVTLAGNVVSPEVRSHAEEISRGVYGVKEVDDEIEIRRQ